MPRFTHNIQLAGYAFQTCDEKGAISFNTFARLFLRFPWGAQMRLREKMADGCSATISVVETRTNSVLWISVQGNDRKPTYIIEWICHERSSIDPDRFLRWKITKMTDAKQDVQAAAKLFFSSQLKHLFHLMAQLPDWKTLEELKMPIHEG